ncbi:MULTISPECIES: helix-turn-helix transcriptional regulator [unclassified Niallia]|uniref:helix-turn-helix transcriptional regulator n=1 Tax=unclassified Niallia TaxID=2837522 RepID=UPI001EDC5836|nr:MULTISPECIES: helix-turn-helix transcriptional regulator [unclassified Niallia]MCM3030633.1 helix-turn-helix transcriptional regulator [Niallia sp. MER 6]MDL0435954.1 helix-turn-helix transcriptional regulator [Niallia sp. SS-2023]UPO86289.1 helix-turn-helix transcriptional regulator [Niallia sp. Man26]
MNDEIRLRALSEFLKMKRAKLQPAMVGLPLGGRRRTTGLRREEVAQLAGVSTTWYTWLEQGRDIKVSISVLEAVSDALRLNKDEKRYLFGLALEETKNAGIPMEEGELITPSIRRILSELHYCPTIITDRRSYIVGWNEAAAQVFLDFNMLSLENRNLIELLFARKELRALAVNWEHFAKGFLSIFRTYLGQYMADDWYSEFIETMIDKYPDFEVMWNESEVSSAPEVMIEFRHSKAGKMLYNLTSLQVHGMNDLRCSIYTPVDGSGTEEKLKQLLKRESK